MLFGRRCPAAAAAAEEGGWTTEGHAGESLPGSLAAAAQLSSAAQPPGLQPAARPGSCRLHVVGRVRCARAAGRAAGRRGGAGARMSTSERQGCLLGARRVPPSRAGVKRPQGSAGAILHRLARCSSAPPEPASLTVAEAEPPLR